MQFPHISLREAARDHAREHHLGQSGRIARARATMTQHCEPDEPHDRPAETNDLAPGRAPQGCAHGLSCRFVPKARDGEFSSAPDPPSIGGPSEGAVPDRPAHHAAPAVPEGDHHLRLRHPRLVGFNDRGDPHRIPSRPTRGRIEWLFKPQPDPRLAIMPVVPMGAAGVLSWRAEIDWLGSPNGRSGCWGSETPQRAASHWPGLRPAYAGEPDLKVAQKPTYPARPIQAEPSKSPNIPVQQSPVQQPIQQQQADRSGNCPPPRTAFQPVASGSSRIRAPIPISRRFRAPAAFGGSLLGRVRDGRRTLPGDWQESMAP